MCYQFNFIKEESQLEQQENWTPTKCVQDSKQNSSSFEASIFEFKKENPFGWPSE